ncbi:hypothetical protein D3C87_1076550 [compost metagenome]
MSEKEAVETAMNFFARTRIALTAKVLTLELDEDSNIWVGVAVSPAGSHRLTARKQKDGTWMISRYLGSLPS